MNLKERGVTVGDLLITIIIIISSIFIISKINDNDKKTYFYINSNGISTILNS